MRISFSTGTFYHRSPRYSMELARELGFDGVELVLGMGYLLRGLEPIAAMSRETGVPVLSVHPPFYPLPGWPRSSLEQIPRVMMAARTLGAGVGVIHTISLQHAHTPRAERFSAGLRRGVAVGGEGVILGLESEQYTKRKRRYLLDDLATLVRYAQERGCGITLDTCHVGANREDLLAGYEIVRPALCNVHLSDVRWQDGEPHTHILPGEGELPLERFLGALARDGYTGLLTMEIHPGQVGLFGRAHQRQRLRQALDFVRAALASASEPTLGTSSV